MNISLRKYNPAVLFFVCLLSLHSSGQVTYSDTLTHYQTQKNGKTVEVQKEEYFIPKGLPKDSFQLRQLPASELKKLENDDAFWYANANIKRKIVDNEGETSLGDQQWFRTLLWFLIIGGFAAFIMIYLANSNISLFSRKNRSLKDAEEDRDEAENIFAINYQREIDKAIKNENYRLAVRLLFLRLLRKFSDKNIIQYKQGRTNLEYLLQLSSTTYYKDFFRITRNYEYSWYGQFTVSPETFTIIQKDVENLENNLK